MSRPKSKVAEMDAIRTAMRVDEATYAQLFRILRERKEDAHLAYKGYPGAFEMLKAHDGIIKKLLGIYDDYEPSPTASDLVAWGHLAAPTSPFKTSKAPYLRDIADALSEDTPSRTVVVEKGVSHGPTMPAPCTCKTAKEMAYCARKCTRPLPDTSYNENQSHDK